MEYTLSDPGAELKWANISIHYDEGEPDGMSEEDMRMYWWDAENNTWVQCDVTGVDTENNVIWANVTHFTVFTAIGGSVGPKHPISVSNPYSMYGLLIFGGFIVGVMVVQPLGLEGVVDQGQGQEKEVEEWVEGMLVRIPRPKNNI